MLTLRNMVMPLESTKNTSQESVKFGDKTTQNDDKSKDKSIGTTRKTARVSVKESKASLVQVKRCETTFKYIVFQDWKLHIV